ncbi:hypothetical protein J6590_071658 [Homalodisca vitripennis]|nr:hypothetical protein J6590_071658 [Homalodisca vitripennis]
MRLKRPTILDRLHAWLLPKGGGNFQLVQGFQGVEAGSMEEWASYYKSLLSLEFACLPHRRQNSERHYYCNHVKGIGTQDGSQREN